MSVKIEDKYAKWVKECEQRFEKLKSIEKEINKIFIDQYGLQEELSANPKDKEISIRKADLNREIKSLLSYAIGCIFGRYSLQKNGIVFAGGEWDAKLYGNSLTVDDNIIILGNDEGPVFKNDVMCLIEKFLIIAYGEKTLEDNINFIARALDEKNKDSRKVIRKYFTDSFYKDHLKVYSGRPIYIMLDSGKKNTFKALFYLHRYEPLLIEKVRKDYVCKYINWLDCEIKSKQVRTSESQRNARILEEKAISNLVEQKENLIGYEEKLSVLALKKVKIDLDDGVLTNYEKLSSVLTHLK